ncbi:MAG TPA: type II toxin-antitoxin system PemK/MazF family toxin [Cytophagaceae bacterium]|jgi:mRNA interferase MazF
MKVGHTFKRFSIHWVDLNPTKGSEINKLRPCVVVSPDELNRHLNTIVILPVTSSGKPYSFRVPCLIKGKNGLILPDQIRSIDKSRIGKKIGELDDETIQKLFFILKELFSI